MADRKIIRARHFVEEALSESLAEVPVRANLPADSEGSGVLGRPLPRLDAREKIAGVARYTFDLRYPRMLHARILRSPYPHARVLSIDSARAEALPGVLAVIHHFNAPEIPWYEDSLLFDPHLRYAGDEVACLAAETEQQAGEALALIRVQYQELAFEIDPLRAAVEGSPVYHAHGRLSGGRVSRYRRGDPEAGFAAAELVVEGEFRTQVAVHNPEEPHCSVARWVGERLLVDDSTQAVYGVRECLAEALGLPESRVEVRSPYMGGGFGSKLEAGKHTVMAALLAGRTGRPVRIALDRREQNLCVGNRPDSVQQLKIGAGRDGVLTALSAVTHGSAGAYSASASCCWPLMTLYACENVEAAQHSVHTNAGRARPFRAPGHVQGTFALESLLDELAERLELDPLDLRIRNHAERDQVYRIPYTSKKLLEAYELGAERFGWRRLHRPAGSDTGALVRGVGLASQIWWGGGGPPAGATLKLNGDGSLRIQAGTQDLGTGTRTILAQTAAEVLELPLERIGVELGDTTSGPYCPLSGGSMTAPSVAPAVLDAARQLRSALLEAGSAIFERPEGDLSYGLGAVHLKEDPARCRTIGELLGELRENTLVRTGLRAANPEGRIVQSFGVQFAEVEVDTLTGRVRVLRIVAAHDIGRILNRRLLENQFEGGIMQGISYALHEERVMDEHTGRVLNPNLLDYSMATTFDLPEIEVLTVPHEDLEANSLGLKGCGEPPIIPTAAAVANAFYNATGLRIRSLPLSPDRVLHALSEG